MENLLFNSHFVVSLGASNVGWVWKSGWCNKKQPPVDIEITSYPQLGLCKIVFQLANSARKADIIANHIFDLFIGKMLAKSTKLSRALTQEKDPKG